MKSSANDVVASSRLEYEKADERRRGRECDDLEESISAWRVLLRCLAASERGGAGGVAMVMDWGAKVVERGLLGGTMLLSELAFQAAVASSLLPGAAVLSRFPVWAWAMTGVIDE
jgi:hypothetical protein